ncbi:Fpg/Nei family DNA glycosylase [Actinocrinis puniceicyclus]|uniref:Fpg/Nei family DNA glycosylase n=1 Tax=Actinocrinis puniceicyclus TaxID=977794 RepID=A0A8J7WRR5_9ACTN|nr:Fpg/Nei family DNA glycosylase [Actinocrinis puniceicyclus]MBS2964189.1 Fpg/Nei family DNA glycosylase [Actinocrinis puniceicyclus]
MPELPEVEALAAFLTERARGLTVLRIDVVAFSALKTFDPAVSALAGAAVRAAGRRGKFLTVDLDGTYLVCHLSRGGWLQWRDTLPSAPPRAGKGPLALRVHLEGGCGWDLTEAGTQKRLAVYVVRDLEEVPGIARLGPDALDPRFDAAALGAVLAERRKQIKGLLTDQSAIAGIGNAYSDEILHTAKLSPFKLATGLSPQEVERLHGAMRSVLTDAVERCVGQRAATLKAEKKTGLRVHGRTGEPCPVCGDTIREVSFSDSSLQYCPTCQTGGTALADRRLSKFGIRT